MGLRELLILILILGIVGIILRGLYVAISSRRGQLKIALEKNVPVYDLEEIEFRELPNGGARVVERSFAHVMKQNSRFATPAKTAAAKYGRGGSKVSGGVVGGGSTRSASGAFAATSAVSSQSDPMLMNPVSSPDFTVDNADLDLTPSVTSSAVLTHSNSTSPLSVSSVSASPISAPLVFTSPVLTAPVSIAHTSVINSAKETPDMDDLISALENELDEELKANKTAQASAQFDELLDNEDCNESLNYGTLNNSDLNNSGLNNSGLNNSDLNNADLNNAGLNNAGLNKEPDELSDDEAFNQNDSHQDDLDPDDDEALGQNDADDDELDDDELNQDGDEQDDDLDEDELDEEFDEALDEALKQTNDLDEQLDEQLEKFQEDLDDYDEDDDETVSALDSELAAADQDADDEYADISYMEPERIEVEIKQPPVLNDIIETRATIQDSIDEDVMYREPGDDNFEDDDFEDDEEDLSDDDRDDDDEEQLADDGFQEMFTGDSLTDDDILGVDRADDDDFDDDVDDDGADEEYRDQAAQSAPGGLMSWVGAKWAAVTAGLAAAADQRKVAAEEKRELLQRRQTEAEERGRQRAHEKAEQQEQKALAAQQRADEKAQRQAAAAADRDRSDPVLDDSDLNAPVLSDDNDILFDDPFNELSAPRETPRVQKPQPRQPQQPKPQQRSLLDMENEGAPLPSDPALYEDDRYSDDSYEQPAPAAKPPKKTVNKKAPAMSQAIEEPRTTQNNNTDPEYNEVLIINVMSRTDREFAGVDVLQALLSCGMRFGDIDIFHRHVDDRGTGPVLFSIANAVNPGTFDLNKINDFSTRGLCFFLTLPNVINNMQAFNKMLDVAQKIRSMLDGEMKDDNRSVMTAQTVEHYRQRILDFELLQLRQPHKQGK